MKKRNNSGLNKHKKTNNLTVSVAQMNELVQAFLAEDYHNAVRFWLEAMLKKGKNTTEKGSTLIVGDSHAIYGIQEHFWKNAINCSVESQDLFYDSLCIHEVLEAAPAQTFQKCLFIQGCYAAYQDLSRNTSIDDPMIKHIYNPIFHDSHHYALNEETADCWQTQSILKKWHEISGLTGQVPRAVREVCEEAVVNAYMDKGSYFNCLNRVIPQAQRGRLWAQLSQEERTKLSTEYADRINDYKKHAATFEENKEIMRELIQYLYSKDVIPIFVIAPMAPDCRAKIAPGLKESVVELLDSVPQMIHFLDFNEEALFENNDFIDTNHLNANGAKKFSSILANEFGA